jgi:uncharacterized damage-inducible protein DinB
MRRSIGINFTLAQDRGLVGWIRFDQGDAMKMNRMMFTLALCCGMGLSAQAQSGVAPAQTIDPMLSMIEGEFMSAAKAMPADKYDFSPKALAIPASKFEDVRTFADQVKHVAQANYFFYMSVSGLKPDMDVKGIGSLKTKDEIVDAAAKSFAFAHRAVATITAENAWLTIKPVDGLNTRVSVATFGVAHGFDHYGQMVEYLRMNGIVPPASAK